MFSTNEFEQKFPTVACLGNFMDDYKAKNAKIGQNALKSAKFEFQMGLFRRKIAMKHPN